jgi:drug/metabolite transporter (DMT)-like permease
MGIAIPSNFPCHREKLLIFPICGCHLTNPSAFLVTSLVESGYPMAYLALAVGLLSIGFSAIFVRQAGAPGTVSAFYRMAIAAVFMMPLFLVRLRGRRYHLTPTVVLIPLLAGVLFALDLSFWATGITLSGATNPTLLANTAPIWVGLGAMFIFRERLNVGFWLGLALAMLGAAFVLGQDLAQATSLGLGTFLGLFAAFFYGAYYLVTQRGRTHLDTLSYFWITVASSSIVLLLINLVLGRPLTDYNAAAYWNFLALGLFVQAFGWLMINYAQGYLAASVVAPTLLIQPVLTAIIAFLLLGERFTAWHIVGGIAVLLGIYVVHQSRSNPEEAQKID